MARRRLFDDDRSEEDRILIHLDPGGPIELVGLTESFSSLARFYERNFVDHESSNIAPKLFVTRLESGSVLAEIAPYFVLLGQMYGAAGASVTVANFVHRFSSAVQTFIDPKVRVTEREASAHLPTREDASDIRDFLRPLAGRKGASLALRHARFQSRDGTRSTIAEYTFSEAEINRAIVNIDKDLDAFPSEVKQQKIHTEVMLFFHQASRDPAKEQGRTSDKAVIPDVYDKPLPVYFRKGINDLKEKMIRGQDNPLTTAFIVDVHVQYVNGVPKGYIVTDVHSAILLDDDVPGNTVT